MSNSKAVPRHVGIIMDGNRRWARARGLPALRGHAEGQEVLRRIARQAFETGIQYLSVYAFSTENWKRSEREVGYLMRHVELALRKYIQEFIEGDVKVIFLGSRVGLPKGVLKAIDDAEAKTASRTAATLAICLNYGGMQELAAAAQSIVHSGMAEDLVTPERMADHLYQPDVPALDLVIRTGGERRLSNFMLWRAAYAELYFTDVLWPDFGPADFQVALDDFALRQRRFGG